MIDQRGSIHTDWRNTLQPIWRSPATWRRVLRTMTPRHHMNDPDLILKSLFSNDFSWLWNVVRHLKWSRHLQETASIPSERALNIIMTQIENESNHELEPKLWWIKGSPGIPTGWTPFSQSGDPLPPGGESADLSRCVLNSLSIDVFISSSTEGHLGRSPKISFSFRFIA